MSLACCSILWYSCSHLFLPRGSFKLFYFLNQELVVPMWNVCLQSPPSKAGLAREKEPRYVCCCLAVLGTSLVFMPNALRAHGRKAGWCSAGSRKDVKDKNKPCSSTAGLCICCRSSHACCSSCAWKMVLRRETLVKKSLCTSSKQKRVAVFLECLWCW